MNNSFFTGAGFLQFEIVFGDPAANLDKVKKLLADLRPDRDVMLALPELWACGFDYANADVHAKKTPQLLQELTALAGERGIYLAGSLLEKNVSEEGGNRLYNTLYFVGPDGVLGRYRKQHLFPPLQEQMHFNPGEPLQPVITPMGLLGGLVCYDLRFPELARQQAFHGTGLLIVSAQWPRVRIDHWQTLLRARAIENQVFVVACNSCGNTDGVDLGGNSTVIGPDGTILLRAGAAEEAAAIGLDAQTLEMVRKHFCPAGERPRPVGDSGKITTLSRLLENLAALKEQKSKVAFTNGCFDILHSGHVAYLEQARSTADCLVVGLNSDSSVRSIKGPSRPVNSENDRARILASLACVDYVVIFNEDDPLDLITAIKPDVLVKGADWAEENIVGAGEVKAAGGRIVRVPFETNESTSNMIARIRSRE